jgi:hypothetical protein
MSIQGKISRYFYRITRHSGGDRGGGTRKKAQDFKKPHTSLKDQDGHIRSQAVTDLEEFNKKAWNY